MLCNYLPKGYPYKAKRIIRESDLENIVLKLPLDITWTAPADYLASMHLVSFFSGQAEEDAIHFRIHLFIRKIHRGLHVHSPANKHSLYLSLSSPPVIRKQRKQFLSHSRPFVSRKMYFELELISN